jgi:hypothetical protein
MERSGDGCGDDGDGCGALRTLQENSVFVGSRATRAFEEAAEK